MPKPKPHRRRRTRSQRQADTPGLPAPGEGLGADAAAAAEEAAAAEAAAWVEGSGSVPPVGSGWFRDEALDEAPDAVAGATPTAPDETITPDEPDATDELEVAAAGEADAVSPPGTIYRTVPPLPEDAAARPPRRSPIVSVLVGLLILVVVGVVGFGVGMLLPLLLPLPAGDALVASPSPIGAEPSATPAANAVASPAATASTSPPASATPSPAATPRIYVVKRGDQLGRIAGSFGVTLQAIQAANGIANPNLIIPGQKLVIPVPVASPGGSPTPSPSAAP